LETGDVTAGSGSIKTGPGTTEDERKALLRLYRLFGEYPQATGLSHLMGLMIDDLDEMKLRLERANSRSNS
jgi:hypothetical protein